MATETTFIAGVEKRVAIFGGVIGILAALIPVGISVARVDPAISSLKATMEDNRHASEKASDATNARLDRIDESRLVELQRLSKTEEISQSTRDLLDKINGKLDRVLMRR